MKTLPSGLTIFNATPHVIRFWREEWPEPVEVEPDQAINARLIEGRFDQFVNTPFGVLRNHAVFVTMKPQPTAEGHDIAVKAYIDDADLVVGSIIAAQAYPGLVAAMIPAPDYERVAPSEKRMRPDKFTVY